MVKGLKGSSGLTATSMEKVIVSPSELQPVPVQEESSSIAIKDREDYHIKALLTPNSTGSGGYNKKKQNE